MQDTSFYLTMFAMFSLVVVVLALFSPKATEVIKIICAFLLSLASTLTGYSTPHGRVKSQEAAAKNRCERKQRSLTSTK